MLILLSGSVSIAGHEDREDMRQGAQPEGTKALAKPATRVQELEALQLEYRVAWPLSIVVDAAALAQYNSLLTFLLQVQTTVLRSTPCLQRPFGSLYFAK